MVSAGEIRGDFSTPPKLWGEAQTYIFYFLVVITCLQCAVAGCQGGAINWTNLQVHIAHRHVKYDIVILEEGKRTYPCFPKCDMFVSQWALNVRHTKTDLCQWGEEWKHGRLAIEEAEAGTAVALTDYFRPLTLV